MKYSQKVGLSSTLVRPDATSQLYQGSRQIARDPPPSSHNLQSRTEERDDCLRSRKLCLRLIVTPGFLNPHSILHRIENDSTQLVKTAMVRFTAVIPGLGLLYL